MLVHLGGLSQPSVAQVGRRDSLGVEKSFSGRFVGKLVDKRNCEMFLRVNGRRLFGYCLMVQDSPFMPGYYAYLRGTCNARGVVTLKRVSWRGAEASPNDPTAFIGRVSGSGLLAPAAARITGMWSGGATLRRIPSC